MNEQMLNSLSVDVEEYFHAANLEPVAPPSAWHRLTSRVEQSTRKVLELFARREMKATFFILGHVARRHPAMVREIAVQGHEIASHGYGHRLVYHQTPKAFYRDIYRSKRLLEDLTGKIVSGYRAPNFSITDKCPWAYDELLRAGYRYDSSVFPTWHPRYSNLGKSRVPYLVQRGQGNLTVVPLAVAQGKIAGRVFPIPVAGGAYWRLLPRAYCRWGLRSMQREQLGVHCYFHPWELDAGQPRFEQLPLLTRIRHYAGSDTFENVIDSFCREIRFVPLADVVRSFAAKNEAQATRS